MRHWGDVFFIITFIVSKSCVEWLVRYSFLTTLSYFEYSALEACFTAKLKSVNAHYTEGN